MTTPAVRVLLVEDSPSDALLLREYLNLVGFERFHVTHVERLEEALVHLRAEAFDVVLLDLSLPDSSGHDTFLRVQREAPRIPLVVLSGTSDEMLGVEAVQHGIQDYLVKGQTDERQIARAIRYAIERRRMGDELERMVEKRTADLRRLNQTLEVIIRCNEAIVRATLEEDLLADICRIIVDSGGYRMAWVGFVQEDPAKTVMPVACAGSENGYLSRVRISWADDEHGRGPTGTAIRTGKPCISHNFRSNPLLSPWREEALRCGFGSSIALPLISDRRVFGCLNIYASESEAFDDRQGSGLQELADDLVFGITALRTRAERDRAQKALERSSAQLRILASELTHAEERERRRLAQAIHDHLQQLLVGAKLCADSLHKRMVTKGAQETVQQLGEFLHESIDAARSLTFELSPPILYDIGLAAALEWLGRWMQAKHGLTVRVKADRQAEPESEDVRALLFQAVRELLFNVVKHAQVKTAEVQMRRFGKDRVRIVVSDKGVGFDPAKGKGEETIPGGFGLFSIRGRLDLLGGQMEIDSAPGRGSSLALLAPLKTAAAVGQTSAKAVAKPAGGSGRRQPPRPRGQAPARHKIRVLLADDHALMRQGLVRLLEEHRDFEVIGEAADGQEALDLARQLKPDVVLMDVSMPRLNGIEATSRLTKELPEVKVIGLSMWEESDQSAAMSKAGAAAYVNKAGPSEALIATIRNCFPATR